MARTEVESDLTVADVSTTYTLSDLLNKRRRGVS